MHVFITYLLQGVLLSMVGPTLLDLQLLTDSSTEQMAFTMTGRTLGMLTGAILYGVIDLKLNVWMVFTVCWFIAMITNAVLPWTAYAAFMGIVLFLQGASYTLCDTGKFNFLLLFKTKYCSILLFSFHYGE